MSHPNTSSRSLRTTGLLLAGVLAASLNGWPPAWAAAPTAISSSPIFFTVTSANPLKPNVMFVLDDSGSMDSDYMPDDARDFQGTRTNNLKYGAVSSQCNGMYYNPDFTYEVPIKSDRSFFPNANFNAVYPHGTNAGQILDIFLATTAPASTLPATIDLSINFSAFDGDPTPAGTVAAPQPAYYYVYKGGQTTAKQKDFNNQTATGTFYNECNSIIGSTATVTGSIGPVNTLFTKVIVSATSGPGGTDERQNFANWYTYYRTRMLMMKSGTGLAMDGLSNLDLTSDYRVGYYTINDNGKTAKKPQFLNITDFDKTQRTAFFDSLYGADTGSSTPLRVALSTVGKYYANNLGAGSKLYNVATVDPVQHSCQRNYTILSTDGFWNETTTPTGLKRGAATDPIGNQDGSLPRATTETTPYLGQFDGTTGGTAPSNTLSDVASYFYNTNLRTTALGNCTAATTTLNPSPVVNELCSTITDSTGKVISGWVKPVGVDTNTFQHMTTFTIGLGGRGRMVFSPSYLTDTSGDFYDVVHGTLTSKTTDCLWRDALTTTTSACNWPIPVSNTLTTIDDLWHAAVNGRGLYFSATDAGELKKGLGTALGGLNKDPNPGAQSPSANPNPQLSATDNFQFSTWFVTVDWYGELLRQEIDPVTGLVIEPGSKPPVVAANFSPLKPDPKTYVWSAQAELNKKVTSTGFASRNIYTNVNGNLTSFIWNQLGAAQANFTKPNISTGLTVPSTVAPLSQFCATPSVCLSATAQNAANVTVASGGAAGEALVNFLRGDTSKQEASGVSDTAKFYRYRAHVLGDIVTAKPVYVGTPDKGYGDTNYAAFADPTTNLLAKQPVVFAAANDGMLHAFDSANGNELWAYIPGLVLPKLYTLADKQYPLRHQFFVEGTPVVGDICPNAPSTPCQAGEWKTILVGGLSGGGTGYYALDITDPQKPKLLWELNDPNMGYSFGVPQITKLDDGTWVVLLTSGYDNCPFNSVSAPNCTKASPNGDGKGHLYVLKANGNAGAAQVIYDISTGSGTAASPSGLAQIMAHASVNNVSSVVYGADLDGKLWHFDISTQTPRAAKLMISLIDPVGNNPQPVTTAPQVTTLNGVTVVYVGTGRFLNINDSVSTSPQQQSIYGVKDISSKIPYGNPRVQTATTNFIVNTAVSVTCPTNTPPSICVPGQITRTVPPVANGDSLANHDGWVTDMPPIAGEIVINDPLLLFGTLFVTSNAPLVNNTSVCTKPGASSDGQGFLYMLDFKTGAGVGTNVAATSLGVGLFSGPQVVRTSDGRLIAVVRDQKGGQIQVEPRFNPAPATKRVSWRELINP